jgi:hypothetical protein
MGFWVCVKTLRIDVRADGQPMGADLRRIPPLRLVFSELMEPPVSTVARVAGEAGSGMLEEAAPSSDDDVGSEASEGQTAAVASALARILLLQRERSELQEQLQVLPVFRNTCLLASPTRTLSVCLSACLPMTPTCLFARLR